MRYFYFLIFLFATATSYCQNATSNFDEVQEKISTYPTSFNNPEELALRIKQDYSTAEEQIVAIYFWVASNIAYDVENDVEYNTSVLFSYSNVAEKNAKENEALQKFGRAALREKIALCQGYASLFKILCDLLNIKCQMVPGTVKMSVADIGEKNLKPSHVWNYYEINGRSYFADPTFGAGTVSNQTFKSNVVSAYLNRTREELSATHFPADVNLQTTSFEDFIAAPFFYSSALENGYRISNFKSGTISLSQSPKAFILVNATPDDFLILKDPVSGNKLEQELICKADGTCRFEIKHLPNVDFYTLYMNGRPTIGWKVVK
jgi:transglutaminase-like putative cysteine protease